MTFRKCQSHHRQFYLQHFQSVYYHHYHHGLNHPRSHVKPLHDREFPMVHIFNKILKLTPIKNFFYKVNITYNWITLSTKSTLAKPVASTTTLPQSPACLVISEMFPWSTLVGLKWRPVDKHSNWQKFKYNIYFNLYNTINCIILTTHVIS